MPLNEYQRRVLKSIGDEHREPFLNRNDHLARVLLPRSPEAQAFRHESAGISHALNVIGLISKGNIEKATEYVEDLRKQVRESSRGVAKDALPILQVCGVIDDLLGESFTVPDGDIEELMSELEKRKIAAEEKYQELQWGDYESR